MNEVATSYPVAIEIPVRFRDLDGLGHVNNAVIATYLEIGREAYWRDAGLFLGIAGYGFLLARIEIDFRRPIPYGGAVKVRLGCPRIGTKSWEYRYRVESLAADETGEPTLYAEARTVQVAVDLESGLSQAVAPAIRAAIDRVERRVERRIERA